MLVCQNIQILFYVLEIFPLNWSDESWSAEKPLLKKMGVEGGFLTINHYDDSLFRENKKKKKKKKKEKEKERKRKRRKTKEKKHETRRQILPQQQKTF